MLLDTWNVALVTLLPAAVIMRYIAYRRAAAVAAASPVAVAGKQAAQLRSLQRRYLAVYFAVKAGDWMQGPYFYDLYASKIDSRTGDLYSPAAISSLFLVGFLSSAVASFVIGGLVERVGRRTGCLVCCFLYASVCVLVRGSSHPVLVVGRVFSGVASALLHSVFEAWLVSQAEALKPPRGWLGNLFSLQWFGDSIVAVAAGVAAQAAAVHGGPVRVFELSAALLVFSMVLVLALWPGDPKLQSSSSSASPAPNSVSAWTSLRRGFAATVADSRVWRLGLVQGLFEGAMYTFVLVWVPVLQHAAASSGVQEDSVQLPLGVVFACFMVCIMLGSAVFSILTGTGIITAVFALRGALVLAALALGPLLRMQSLHTVAVCFFVFEACCGVFFPSSGSVRSDIVPPQHATVVLTLYRIPLNLFVVGVMVNLTALGTDGTLAVCSGALTLAAALQFTFSAGSDKPKTQ